MSVETDQGEQKSERGRLWARRWVLGAIGFYQHGLSPMLPASCRFTPSCSHYTYGAIERFGLWRGGWMGFKRVCRCNPLCPGGFDPVPEIATKVEPELAPEPDFTSENPPAA